MAYTQTQLDALQEAMASGELEVSYDGRQVKYRSIAELQAAIKTVARNLNAQTSRITPTRVVRMSCGKGY